MGEKAEERKGWSRGSVRVGLRWGGNLAIGWKLQCGMLGGRLYRWNIVTGYIGRASKRVALFSEHRQPEHE